MTQINANSRQQFIIEEEGAYSQRSSEDESEQKKAARGGPVLQQLSYNTNSQLNLQKKSSHPTATHMKQNTFAYGHQGSQHSTADALVLNKTNSRNGPRGESYNENGGPGGSNFNGDTGHDYNFQQ